MSARAQVPVVMLVLLGAQGCGTESTGAGDVLVVAAVEITPSGITLVAGSTAQLNATPKTSSGIPVPNRQVTWSSDDQGIATVSNEGIVTGVSTGATRVNASVDGVSASIPVEISAKAVATVSVTPSQVTLMVGATEDLTVVSRSSDGEVLTGRPVTFSSDNPEIATISETGVVTGVGPGLTVVTATVEGRSATVNVDVTALPASRLDFQNDPGTGAAGSPLPPVRVEVQDSEGGTVREGSAVVTLEFGQNPTGAVLSGTLTTSAVNGVATFNDLRVNQVGTGYTLRATSGSLTPAESAPFAIVAGTAARLTIATQPSPAATNDIPLAVQPRIQIRDAEGNAVAQGGVQITAVLEGSGATLEGDRTITTNAEGVGIFTDLVLSGASGTYTILFAAPGLTAIASNAIVLSTGEPAALALIQQPSPAAETGVAFERQPIVQLLDANGNAAPRSGIAVTAAIASGGGTLGGTITRSTDASGRATFTDLAISGAAGTRTLAFTATGLTGITSEPIGITVPAPPEAARLILTTAPSTIASSGAALSTQPSVQVADASGNPVAQGGTTITAVLASGPAGASLTNATATTNPSGLAVFSGLAITGDAGSYTLRFESGSLDPVTSATITLSAAAATSLSITTQPSSSSLSGSAFAQQPVLQLRDGSGNPVSQAGVSVTASIATGGGTLGGNVTATTDASGEAAFGDLMITGSAGPRTLQFGSPGLSAVTSTSIEITEPQPASLRVLTQPSSSAQNGKVIEQQPSLLLAKGSGEPVGNATVNATIGTGPSGSILSGASAVTNSSGVATFSSLTINGTVGTYTLQFAGGGAAPASSSSILLGAGDPAAITIETQPPATATNGAGFSTSPVVAVQDGSGNAVAGTAVGAARGSGPGELGGTLSRTTAGNGRAAFNDLSLTGLVGTYTIEFSQGGRSAVSRTISLTAGPDVALAIITQPPGTAKDDKMFDSDPEVGLRDVSGNPVARSGVSITVSLETVSGSGNLEGGQTRNTDNGVARFNNLRIDGQGTFRLRFASPGHSGVTSSPIVVER